MAFLGNYCDDYDDYDDYSGLGSLDSWLSKAAKKAKKAVKKIAKAPLPKMVTKAVTRTAKTVGLPTSIKEVRKIQPAKVITRGIRTVVKAKPVDIVGAVTLSAMGPVGIALAQKKGVRRAAGAVGIGVIKGVVSGVPAGVPGMIAGGITGGAGGAAGYITEAKAKEAKRKILELQEKQRQEYEKYEQAAAPVTSVVPEEPPLIPASTLTPLMPQPLTNSTLTFTPTIPASVSAPSAPWGLILGALVLLLLLRRR